jgi:uncharacterized Zn-finger protein
MLKGRIGQDTWRPIVRIGCREFECIGDKPPQDHPHVYLNMGDASDIVCPSHAKLIQQNVFTVTSTESKSKASGPAGFPQNCM